MRESRRSPRAEQRQSHDRRADEAAAGAEQEESGDVGRLRDGATRDRADDRRQSVGTGEQALCRPLQTRWRSRREDGHATDEDAREADALERGDEDQRDRVRDDRSEERTERERERAEHHESLRADTPPDAREGVHQRHLDARADRPGDADRVRRSRRV